MTPPFDITSQPPRAGTTLLHEIVDQTGGRKFEVTRLKQLPDIAAKIGGLLRDQ